MLISMLRKAVLPAAALTLWAGAHTMALAADVTTISLAEYHPSSTPSIVSMPLDILDERKDIQEKHGINLEIQPYSNLSALYSDLALGRTDAAVSGPATLATFATKGAPLSLAGTLGRATNAVLSNGKPWSADDLRGSRLVAQTSSSSWIVVKAIIERDLGLVAGEDYDVINSESTAAAAVQVAAGKADYAIVRAEQVILALKKFPNLKMVATPQDLGREKGAADWGYIIAYNHEKQDYAAMEKLMAALADVAKEMNANPGIIEERAVEAGQEPGVAAEMLSSGLFKPEVLPGKDAEESLRADFDLLRDVGFLETDWPESVFPK